METDNVFQHWMFLFPLSLVFIHEYVYKWAKNDWTQIKPQMCVIWNVRLIIALALRIRSKSIFTRCKKLTMYCFKTSIREIVLLKICQQNNLNYHEYITYKVTHQISSLQSMVFFAWILKFRKQFFVTTVLIWKDRTTDGIARTLFTVGLITI